MLEFKRIDLSDREWIEPVLQGCGYRGSEYVFSNNFIYRKIYHIDVALMNGFYLVRSNKEMSCPSSRDSSFPWMGKWMKNTLDKVLRILRKILWEWIILNIVKKGKKCTRLPMIILLP